jgi:SAM-dependent methyltransferase
VADSEIGFRPPPKPAFSFRDPNGVLFSSNDRIFRLVNSAGAADLRNLLASQSAQKLQDSGRLVSTRVLDAAEMNRLLESATVAELYAGIGGEIVVEHERIPFPSFPYEWAPDMLHAAAVLTLQLVLDLLPENLGLKDATPYNVLFRGPQPVFIDALSVERREPGDPGWTPYAQFVRTFLLPLLANRYFGISLEQSLLSRRDGLEPEDVYRWLRPWQLLRPPFFSLVAMPTWLAKRHNPDNASIYQKKIVDPEKAGFIFRSMIKGLQRAVQASAPSASGASAWTGYMESNNYTDDHFSAKERFVREALNEHTPGRVLDVGCNTGHFSALAARSGVQVVSIDYDPAVVGAVWRKANHENLNILPLVVNLTRPTPGTGWQNREWPSFLDRARGAFDMVLMLAVIHHMLVTERVPLNSIVDQAAELTRNLLVIEFVSPRDSMFQRLVRGREELHQDLSPEVFENSCRRRFEVVRAQHVEGTTRWLYLMRRKER